MEHDEVFGALVAGGSLLEREGRRCLKGGLEDGLSVVGCRLTRGTDKRLLPLDDNAVGATLGPAELVDCRCSLWKVRRRLKLCLCENVGDDVDGCVVTLVKSTVSFDDVPIGDATPATRYPR